MYDSRKETTCEDAPGLWSCQGGTDGTGSTSSEDRAGGEEESRNWNETQGLLSPEARLVAVDPQGSQLNLKSGRSALGASSF